MFKTTNIVDISANELPVIIKKGLPQKTKVLNDYERLCNKLSYQTQYYT
jgi:hypothetical protein